MPVPGVVLLPKALYESACLGPAPETHKERLLGWPIYYRNRSNQLESMVLWNKGKCSAVQAYAAKHHSKHSCH